MARVIFPSGGAFKPARPQHVQAYRAPRREKSSFLTDATRAVDLVGKIVDNPLVSYITNEIYNAARDMDPEEVAQGAMKEREQARAQRFERGWDAAGIRDEDNAEEIALQRQLAAGMDPRRAQDYERAHRATTASPGPMAQAGEVRRGDAGAYQGSYDLLRGYGPGGLTPARVAEAQDMVAARRRAQEAGLDNERERAFAAMRRESAGNRAALESYGRTPSAPEEVIQEQVEVTEEVQTGQPAGSITPGRPREVSVEEKFAGHIAPAMPPGTTGIGRLAAARGVIDGIAKVFAGEGKPKDFNAALRKTQAHWLAQVYANLRATGNPSGRLPEGVLWAAATETYDGMHESRSVPARLPSMRQFKSINDILIFVMNNPNLSMEQQQMLVSRGGDLARLKKGVRGLSDVRERGESLVLRAIAASRKGHQGVDPDKRFKGIVELYKLFDRADKQLVTQLSAMRKMKPLPGGGDGTGKTKRRKGGSELWEVKVEVDGKGTYMGAIEAYKAGIIPEMPNPETPSWAPWAEQRLAQGVVRSTANTSKKRKNANKDLRRQASSHTRTRISDRAFAERVRASSVSEERSRTLMQHTLTTQAERTELAGAKQLKQDALKALKGLREENARLGREFKGDQQRDEGPLDQRYQRALKNQKDLIERITNAQHERAKGVQGAGGGGAPPTQKGAVTTEQQSKQHATDLLTPKTAK
jgi:hypothetical protein